MASSLAGTVSTCVEGLRQWSKRAFGGEGREKVAYGGTNEREDVLGRRAITPGRILAGCENTAAASLIGRIQQISIISLVARRLVEQIHLSILADAVLRSSRLKGSLGQGEASQEWA